MSPENRRKAIAMIAAQGRAHSTTLVALIAALDAMCAKQGHPRQFSNALRAVIAAIAEQPTRKAKAAERDRILKAMRECLPPEQSKLN